MTVGVLAVALVISLIDRPSGTIKTGSAADSIRIACAELGAVDPHAQPDTTAFDLNPFRIGMASGMAQLAARQDRSLASITKILEQPASDENLSFTLDPKHLAAALTACRKY